MKSICALLVVFAIVAPTFQLDDKMMEIMEKGKLMCLKKTGCEEGRIVELVLTHQEEWPGDVTDGEKCFFQCAFKLMAMLDKNNFFDCEKAKKAIKTFCKSGKLKDIGDVMLPALDDCCPKLRTDDPCMQNWDLVHCMYFEHGDELIELFV